MKRTLREKLSITTVFFTSFLFSSGAVLGQANFSSKTSDNWSSPSCWAVTSGTDADGIPDENDNVLILAGHTITVDIATASAASVNINTTGGNNTNGTLSFLNSTSKLTVGGDVTIGREGNGRLGTMNMANGGTLIANFLIATNNSAFTPGTTSTIELRGSGTLPNPNNGAFGTFNNLIINKGSVVLSKNITITGDLSVIAGTLDLATFTSNRSPIGGAFFVENGAVLKLNGTNNFTSGFSSRTLRSTSTVEYYGGNQTIANLEYGNLILSGSGTKTLASVSTINGNFIMAGTASATAATAMVIGANVVLDAGTTFNAGSLNHQVKGNWNNNGGSFNANGSTVTFNGTALQTIGGSSTTTFNNLVINNAASASLDQNISVNGTLTLTDGLFTILAGKTLTLSSPTAVAGTDFGLGKHIVTQVNRTTGEKGVLRVNGISAAFEFPIGNGTYYLPATVIPSAASDLGLVVFEDVTRNGQPNGPGAEEVLKGRIVDVMWDLTNFSNNNATATVQFAWPDNDNIEGNDFQGFTDNQIGISQYNPTTNQFSRFEGEPDRNDQTATRSGVALLASSQFLVGEAGAQSSLPVRFANVKAAKQSSGIQLSFSNLTEEDVAVYHVERSANGINYQSIGTLTPKANNNDRSDYVYVDKAPLSGGNYYRIRAVETDGKQVYSAVVKISAEGSAAGLVLYPNPASQASGINLQLANLPAGVYNIRLFNEMGQLIGSKQLRHTGGSVSESLPLNGAQAGRYIVDVKGAVQFTKSFLLQ